MFSVRDEKMAFLKVLKLASKSNLSLRSRPKKYLSKKLFSLFFPGSFERRKIKLLKNYFCCCDEEKKNEDVLTTSALHNFDER